VRRRVGRVHGPGRAIDNRDTLLKIEEYLRPDVLRELFGEWLAE
jgi:hypothetical protein